MISSWTQEERDLHARLVLECLKRERSLIGIKGKVKISEDNLKQSLDLLLSELKDLTRTADETAGQMEDICLLLTKGQGNA